MAQRIMGDMLDYAFNTYDMEIDKFFAIFIVSDVSRYGYTTFHRQIEL